MTRLCCGLLCTFANLSIGAIALTAQGVTGTAIEGRVSARDGTAIVEAEVSATNASNGERWRTVTGNGGRFALEHLSVGGPYRIEARAIGFQPLRRDSVFLSLGQRLRVDVVLLPGVTMLEPIVVHAADDPLINAGRTGPSQVIAESTIARLPIGGRNLTGVAWQSPLVTGDGSVAGQNAGLTNLQVDGTAASDLLGGINPPGLGLGLRTIAVEAVKEIEVLAAPFDVRFGTLSAGLVNAVTKSGSNRFEGSAFGYYTGPAVQGKDETGHRADDFVVDEAGLTLGGPIVRDRAAFFIEAGRQHGRRPIHTPIIGTDTTGGADSVGVGFRRASVTRLQEVMRDTYGVEAGGTDPYPVDVAAGNVFGKVTVQLGVNSRLELSHEYSRSTPDLLDEGCRRAQEVFCLGSTAFQLVVRDHISRLAWATAFGRRLSNDLMLARSRYRQTCRTTDFPLVFVHADAGDLGAGGNSLCVGDRVEEEILELTDNLSLTAGSHRFTLGTHGELIRLPTHYNLAYFFAAGWHFQSTDSLAAGQPDGFGGVVENPVRQGGPLSDLRTRLFSPYVQDQWSATPKLLVTAGLRADVPFVSRHPIRNTALREAPLGLDNTQTPSGHLLWSPRLGVSYDLRGDGNTFLRGGIGLFAGRPAYRWFNEVYTHTGLDAVELACDSTNVPAFTTDLAGQPTACAGSGGVNPVAGPVSVFDPGFRFPRSLKIAVGADHRLPWGLVGTLDLLYTQGVNQLDLRELNLNPPTAVAFGEGSRPLYGTIADDGTATPSRRSPAFGRVTQVRSAHGDRSFSLTAQIQRHFAGGQELSASYTYTSARDLLSATDDRLDGNLDAVTLDGSLENRRLAPSAWSVPHRVTLQAIADLPLHFRLTLSYEGRSGVPVTYRVEGDANADGYGNDAVYIPANSAPGGDIQLVIDDDQGVQIPAPASVYAELDRFIKEQGCLRAQRGHVMRRNSCRNPWTNNADARFSRVFPTTKGQSLELTLDVFNLPHLLNGGWGLNRGLDDSPLLAVAGYDAAAGRGVYRFLARSPRAVDFGGARWQMYLGARYTF
ncbi:MAG: TonB-dependent receptor [Gemmatimonadales bacterium]